MFHQVAESFIKDPSVFQLRRSTLIPFLQDWKTAFVDVLKFALGRNWPDYGYFRDLK
jgi:hypothetical protein